MARPVKQDNMGVFRYADNGERVGMELPAGMQRFDILPPRQTLRGLDDSKPLLRMPVVHVEDGGMYIPPPKGSPKYALVGGNPCGSVRWESHVSVNNGLRDCSNSYSWVRWAENIQRDGDVVLVTTWAGSEPMRLRWRVRARGKEAFGETDMGPPSFGEVERQLVDVGECDVKLENNPPLPLPDRLQVGDVWVDERFNTRIVEFADGKRFGGKHWQLNQPHVPGEEHWRTRQHLIAGPSYEAARYAIRDGKWTRDAKEGEVVPVDLAELAKLGDSMRALTPHVQETARVMDDAVAKVKQPTPRPFPVSVWPGIAQQVVLDMGAEAQVTPTPRPGQVWRGGEGGGWEGSGLLHTIIDVIPDMRYGVDDDDLLLFRRETGERVEHYACVLTRGAHPLNGFNPWTFISGPTQPETPHERRARELRLDLEWHRPASVTPAEYTRRYTGSYEGGWREGDCPFTARRLAREAGEKGGKR